MTRRTERTVLPLLPRREERGGERRGIFARVSPLPNPLPARSSRGEGEDSPSPNRLIQRQCSLTLALLCREKHLALQCRPSCGPVSKCPRLNRLQSSPREGPRISAAF